MRRSSESRRPRVSVCVTTCDQEAFIGEALGSALAQQAPFDLEIVVGEDASTDGTRVVIAELAARFPNQVVLLSANKRRGLVQNFLATFDSCRGEYVALLDGDDYWTRLDKLARQVAFLDAHPECSM